MANGLIAKKVGMSRVFLQDTGEAVPVTYLQVEPNKVVRCKTEDKDGYNAVVLGVGEKKWKTRKGKEHTKYAVQKEWKVESTDGLNPGTEITAQLIPEDGTVTITGVSKGKGFQGVIKRHNFSRGPETHGSHHHRRPGSVGMCEFPGRVLKGKKMPGRMGTDQVTVRNRAIVFTDPEKGLVGVKGPVPGPNGATVYLTFEFEADLSALQSAPAAEASVSASDEATADKPAEEKAEAKTEEKKEEAKTEEKVEDKQEETKEEEKKEEAPAEEAKTEEKAEEPKEEEKKDEATDDSSSDSDSK